MSDIIKRKSSDVGLPGKRPSEIGKKRQTPVGIPSKADQREKRFAAQKEYLNRKVSVAFLFDATASRQENWREAQEIQAQMISEFGAEGSNVEIGIFVHSGERVHNIGWFQNPLIARQKMAEVHCEGGHTCIAEGLIACSKKDDGTHPQAIVIVGDCCEDDEYKLRDAANTIRQMGIPVHAFQEGWDFNGKRMYKMVADITKGAFAKFGSDMPLRDLIKPLFVHSVKGVEAFQKLIKGGDKGARALVQGGFKALPPPQVK